MSDQTVAELDYPMNVQQASELTGFTVRTLYTYVAAGIVPVHKPTGRKLVFFRSELIEFLKRGKKKTSYELAEEATRLLSRRRKTVNR